MRHLYLAVASLLALHAVAETRSLDGVVKTASGAPAAAMSVAATLMPSAEADDVAAKVVTGADGNFHFNLPPGKYSVSATSATKTCSEVATADLTTAAVQNLELKTSDSCRVISGTVTGAKDVHVIAGRFVSQNPDIYSIAAPGGRYKIAVPDNSFIVVQAIASKYVSVEMPIASKSGDATADLLVERHFTAMPDEARKWVAANAVPLTTVEAGHGFDDLAPLRKLVGNARIVSLGEATHGTREFFQFKHRMLEFLVTKMGFNLFGIEASSPDAIAVDDYVMTGKGDPALALHNLGFWTWDTQEVLDMILWMRKWNEDPAHTTKVHFYGFDMQSPSAAEKRLRPWLTANLADAVAILDRAAPLMRPRGGMTADQRKDVTAAVAELITKIDAHPAHDAAWLNARHFAELLQQAIPLDVEHGARDRAMAENIKWTLDHEQPNSKMVVWAHNGHVAAEALPFSPGGTMGFHLRKMFGPQMVVVGFVFDHGKFRAVHRAKGLIEHTAMSLEEKTFDRGLATSGPPLFVLDLRPAKGVTREWLDSPLENRSIGAVYDEASARNFIGRIHPLRSFDAIFFINETTAAHSLRPSTSSSSGAPRSEPAPAPVNLSLDDGIKGWMATTLPSYPVTATTEGCFKGGCATVTRKSDATAQFGVFMQSVDATPYRGKKIRLRGKMKSTMVGEGSARLWLRVDKPSGMGFFDNMEDRGIRSLPQWTDLEIVGEVAPDAESINFGLLMLGDGTAMMDEVTLEEVK